MIFLKILTFLSLALNIACSSAQELPSFDAELSNYKYPFAVQEYFFESQEQRLQMTYADLGNRDSKKVVALLHGKNFSGYYWDVVAKGLVNKGYRVIIMDQVGFGKSSKPKFYQFSFQQLALNTLSLVESLGVKNLRVVGVHRIYKS